MSGTITRTLSSPTPRARATSPRTRNGSLRPGPDGELVVNPLGDRGPRFERDVRDVGDRVRRLHRFVRSLQPRVDGALRSAPAAPESALTAGAGFVLQVLEQLFRRDLRRRLPLGLDRVQSLSSRRARSARRRRRSRRRGRPSLRPSPPRPSRSPRRASACNAGGRSTLPKSIPGRRMSEAYWCAPVTNVRPSTFGTDVPATIHLFAGGGRHRGRDHLHQLLALRELRRR